MCKMEEVGERWDIYTRGCFGLGLGFRPKPVTAQRPTRNRPVASHGLDSRTFIYNTYIQHTLSK